MPRVLITGFCAVPGASRAGVQLRHVVRALSAEHAVDLLVVRDADQAYVERQGTVRILRVPTHDDDVRAQIQSFQRALRRQLDGADYDIVHCRDGWSCRTVLEVRPNFGFAVVFDLSRGPWVEPAVDPELAVEIDRDTEACLAAADLALVPTEPARRYAVARTRPERVVVSPPGVDVDRFDWEDPVVDAGPPVILYAGTIEPGRGVRTLLRAMMDVLHVTPARLVLAGPIVPGFADPLHAAIRDLSLTRHVEILSVVDHDAMPQLIAQATVCVAPAAPDLAPRATALYPTKLLEFMACRRAVVAPRRGTVAMLIDHGREGMLFQPGDPGDLARKVIRLLQDPDLRGRMAQHGYERVRREFTASGARRAVRTAYAGLAARPEFRARFLESQTGTARAASPVPSDMSSSEPVLADDDYEATVYEATVYESPRAPAAADDLESQPALAALPALDSALEALEADAGRAEAPVTEERELANEDTAERSLRPPERSGGRRFGLDSGAFTTLSARPHDEWVVTGEARRAPPPRGPDDEGTPVDVALTPPPEGLPSFVAGEIDVPTPAPEIVEADGVFTAASELLGPRGEADDPEPVRGK
ncbi:MAG: glycosyltransferase family 4 protein [Kofleriaceae bacterium]|nr:glycosyltransferase family 4 protein [Kofleriaceae bacterium]MCB9574905.1 glycosyltransferase family 4 protein [Kofleriaceae bacterium]